MRHGEMRPEMLVNYALRLNVGAVIRRLGYLLDLYGLAQESELGRLRTQLTATYAIFDPLLPKEGSHNSKWRLQLNISPEELQRLSAA